MIPTLKKNYVNTVSLSEMFTHHIKITQPTAHKMVWRREGLTTRGEKLRKEINYMWEIDIPRTFFNQKKYELLVGIGSPSDNGQNDSDKDYWLCNEKNHVYHIKPNSRIIHMSQQHPLPAYRIDKDVTKLGFILTKGELGFVHDTRSLISLFKINDDTFKQGIYPLMFLKSVDGIINIISSHPPSPIDRTHTLKVTHFTKKIIDRANLPRPYVHQLGIRSVRDASSVTTSTRRKTPKENTGKSYIISEMMKRQIYVVQLRCGNYLTERKRK